MMKGDLREKHSLELGAWLLVFLRTLPLTISPYSSANQDRLNEAATVRVLDETDSSKQTGYHFCSIFLDSI